MKLKDIIENIWRQKILGLFFIIALTLWYMTKLSGSYTTDIIIPIELVTEKESGEWIENPLIKVKANCQSDGRTILSYRMNLTNSIQVPVSKLVIDKKSKYQYSIELESLARAIQSQTKELNINYINDTVPTFNLAETNTKKVPIISDINISYAAQHMNPTGKIILGFDSVTVKAPSIILDTINSIRTIEVWYKNLNHPVKSDIALLIPDNIVSDHTKVPYEINVERCTQYKFTIDVASSKPARHEYSGRTIFQQIVAEKNSLTVIPKQVTIFLNMPLSADTKKNDIKAYVDYNSRSSSPIYDVKLDHLPEGSEIIAIEPRVVNVYKNIKD